MNIRIQILIFIVVLIALLIIVNMIRTKKLELKYALSWLFVGCGILILDLCPSLVSSIAGLCGVVVPINMLFFLGFCFSLIIIFTLTVTISRMSIKLKDLTQEIALFENERKKEDNDVKNGGTILK